MKIDKVIILSLIITDYLLIQKKSLETINLKDLVDYARKNFTSILKNMGLNIKSNQKEILEKIISLLFNDELKTIELEENKQNNYDIKIYMQESSSNILEKLKQVSKENALSLERVRDKRVISLLNIYYLKNYAVGKMLKCECCGQTTFLKPNNEPYLEFHHLIPFSIANGPDHYKNIFGLCPMCHRKIHSGADNLKQEIYKNINKNNYFKESILDRFKSLYDEKILKSYHLEYALAEQIISESEYKNFIP